MPLFSMGSLIEIEIRNDGYMGSKSTLRHYIAEWKRRSKHVGNLEKSAEDVIINRKDILKLLYNPISRVDIITMDQFEAVREQYPCFASVYDLVWDFKNILTKKDVNELMPWIERAKCLMISEINSFVEGIYRDIPAVKNAINLDYSSGIIEGSINKLKVIKRIMFGRCSFNTLKIKTLSRELAKNQFN